MSEQPKEDDLNVAYIYGALMRPAMVLGVHSDYIPIALIAFSVLMVWFNPIVAMGALPLIWLFGYLVTRFDPDGFPIIRKRGSIKWRTRKIRKIAGASVYEPF
jgi:type IV secretory pathway VirB3-like protein